jgi:hypothetical protein
VAHWRAVNSESRDVSTSVAREPSLVIRRAVRSCTPARFCGSGRSAGPIARDRLLAIALACVKRRSPTGDVLSACAVDGYDGVVSDPSVPQQLIDLDAYPVHDLHGASARALIERCRGQLRADGACELPGFVTPQAIARMVRESDALVPVAHHAAGPITIYLGMPDMSLPEGHPRRHLGSSSLAAIAYDLFPSAHALRALYEWDPLMTFLAAALGRERLHRYADPFGALNVAVMGDGDELDWHFDQTDFVVSIALRDADEGGDFEYAPLLRSASDERYDDVRAVLGGDTARVRRVPMTPGTLLLFEGRHSLHRVTRIHGATSRLVALLAYDTKPGTMSSELLRLARYGRTAPAPAAQASSR